MHLIFAVLGTLLLAASVFLGAYGEHGLYEAGAALDEVRAWDWANRLHGAHALGLLVVAGLLRQQPESLFYKLTGWLLIAGIVLFSASIYLKILGGPDLAAWTPFGGMSLAAAWLCATVAVWRDFSGR
ncbi:DUF423 domain-containing protein [Candidatus Foliamicus sp.]